MAEKNLFDYDVSTMDIDHIDKHILSILYHAGLSKDNNVFFIRAHNIQKINVTTAFNIAYNWREITKTFLFTTISGLGCLAKKVGREVNPNQRLLSVMQTGFQIISDDLGNNRTLFPDSPHGHQSIHYKWWEDTILTPLSVYIDIQKMNLTHATAFLIKKMQKITKNYLGVAVQLRVVEAIAQDICLAFLAIFSKVEYQGKKIFNSEKDLAWIYSHIEAETIHHRQVCDEESGMGRVVLTLEDKRNMLALAHEYACAWSNALNNLAEFLKCPAKLP